MNNITVSLLFFSQSLRTFKTSSARLNSSKKPTPKLQFYVLILTSRSVTCDSRQASHPVVRRYHQGPVSGDRSRTATEQITSPWALGDARFLNKNVAYKALPLGILETGLLLEYQRRVIMYKTM